MKVSLTQNFENRAEHGPEFDKEEEPVTGGERVIEDNEAGEETGLLSSRSSAHSASPFNQNAFFPSSRRASSTTSDRPVLTRGVEPLDPFWRSRKVCIRFQTPRTTHPSLARPSPPGNSGSQVKRCSTVCLQGHCRKRHADDQRRSKYVSATNSGQLHRHLL